MHQETVISSDNFFQTNKAKNRWLRLRESTRRTYFGYIEKFINYFGTNITEENVLSFLRWLPKKVRNKAFYALKFYALMNDIDFPLTPKDIPPDFFPDFYDRNAEIFKKEEIEKFVKGIQKGLFDPVESLSLVLAIIYGLRAIEIRNMKKGDIDLTQGIFLVRTAKKGRKRFHLIPPTIKQYFYIYISGKGKFHEYLFKSYHFHSICKRVDVPIVKQRGWHAFRRTLVTELLQTGIPDVKVYDFMRWSRREIIYKYYLPEFKRIDQEIFEKHPFLPLFSPISY